MSTPSTKFDVDDRIWSPAVEPAGSVGCPVHLDQDSTARLRSGVAPGGTVAARAAPSSRRSDRADHDDARRRADDTLEGLGVAPDGLAGRAARHHGQAGAWVSAAVASDGGSSEPAHVAENTMRKSAAAARLVLDEVCHAATRRTPARSSWHEPDPATRFPEYSSGEPARLTAVVVAHVQDTDADRTPEAAAAPGSTTSGSPPVLDELPGHAGPA